MSKKTFLYIRVSTLDQVNGAESQARALLEWCTRNNITEYETFTDHGVSGAKESRPALDKMMERVKRLEADQVIVFAFSRFARSTMHLLKGLQVFYVVPTFGTFTCARKSRRIRLNKTVRWAPSISARLCAS